MGGEFFWKAKDSQILVFEHKSGVGPVDWSSSDKSICTFSLHVYW